MASAGNNAVSRTEEPATCFVAQKCIFTLRSSYNSNQWFESLKLSTFPVNVKLKVIFQLSRNIFLKKR